MSVMPDSFDGPLTLNEFVQWMALHMTKESMQAIYCFKGAWLAGHTMRTEHFPQEQVLPAWLTGYAEWQKVLKEVVA